MGLRASRNQTLTRRSITTVSYTRGVKHSGWPSFRGRLRQRNYYEHIIHNEESLNLIRQYIVDSPPRWSFDRENPVVRATRLAPLPDEPWRI
jgi:REP element-mobilizing transposase RayT